MNSLLLLFTFITGVLSFVPYQLPLRHGTALAGIRRSSRKSKTAPEASSSSPYAALNKGLGLKISGVTLPTKETQIVGWILPTEPEQCIAAFYRGAGRYTGLQANCPRCGFNLYQGTLVTPFAAVGDFEPAISCPTCKTNYLLSNGNLAGKSKTNWVANLARSTTADKSQATAESWSIVVDEGEVYAKPRK